MTKEGILRTWRIVDPPASPFYVEVESVDEAKKIIALLDQYDLFLGDRIGSNAAGLEVFEAGEWVEWQSEEGDDIAYIMREEESRASD